MGYREKCQERVKLYVRTMHERIAVTGGVGMFNYRCFYNAVEQARKTGDDVYEVIYLHEGNEPVLHYVNRRPDGVFVDNTLGTFAEEPTHEYYLIRKIAKGDYRYISSEFSRSCDSWTERFSHPLLRRLFQIRSLV